MKNQLPPWYKGKKKECDRCSFVYPLSELRRQDGLLLCEKCLDRKKSEGGK